MHTDLELLQGFWSITSLAMDGQEMHASMFANAGIVVNANRFTSIGMGAEYEGTLEIDQTTNPRQLNMKFDVGPATGHVHGTSARFCVHAWQWLRGRSASAALKQRNQKSRKEQKQ